MRLLRLNPELLRNQVRAILRASAFGNIRFMFPMIANLQELRESKDTVRDVMAELSREGISYDQDIKIGIMIEVPAAAVMAESFAGEADFFSIGTNDLIQYTLAVDRDNEHVSHLYSPVDPSVLKLIRLTVEAGERADVEVSMCGEMAGDIVYSMLLVGMGIRRLSMAPSGIADVKKLVRSITLDQAKAVAERAMSMDTAGQIDRFLAQETRKVIPELIEEPPPE